jgi:hypothetical protein
MPQIAQTAHILIIQDVNRDRKDILDSPGTLNRREQAARCQAAGTLRSSPDIRKKRGYIFMMKFLVSRRIFHVPSLRDKVYALYRGYRPFSGAPGSGAFHCDSHAPPQIWYHSSISQEATARQERFSPGECGRSGTVSHGKVYILARFSDRYVFKMQRRTREQDHDKKPDLTMDVFCGCPARQ